MNVGILVGLLVSSYILEDMTTKNSIGLEKEENQNKFKRNQRESGLWFSDYENWIKYEKLSCIPLALYLKWMGSQWTGGNT